MKKHICQLLLVSFCCMACFSGCRRKPVETETQSETETQTQPETIKQTETQKQSETKKATVTPNSVTAQTDAPTQTQTTEPASQQCPYCGNWYYIATYADGTSDYSIHVAAEEQAQQSVPDDYDPSQYYTGNDGTEYAQCEYCYQWFSTAQDANGYSPYADHVAAESAYAAMQQQEEYVQCPVCGNWVTASEYQDHVTYGY
ncbi:MAG: hypothetical protein Q4F83_06770 [Eubacteriales bacterium]|nr:hypothetical protein [Eubacteriales bacterium]